MIVHVVLEHRFDRTPDGKLWTYTQFPYSFWQRYLEVFDFVVIVARVNEVNEVSANALRTDGLQVTYVVVPHYLGPSQFLSKLISVRSVLKKVASSDSALILRIPSTLGMTIPQRALFKRPYGLEVVADPWDIFAPGAVQHPLRFLFRRIFTNGMKKQIANSAGAAYVTRETLQRRYATRKMYWYSDAEIPSIAKNFYFSSIELPGTSIGRPKESKKVRKVITVGSLSNHYKGVDILIEAVSILVKRGISIELYVVGDGKMRPQLEKQAIDSGVGSAVRFLGIIPSGQAVFDALDAADLFVMASRTEGLPRALIEAMARGLPCIGSSVGGIPELLESENMVDAGNPLVLANKIDEIRNDSLRLENMSYRNLEIARSFESTSIAERRRDFYKCIEIATKKWMIANRE